MIKGPRQFGKLRRRVLFACITSCVFLNFTSASAKEASALQASEKTSTSREGKSLATSGKRFLVAVSEDGAPAPVGISAAPVITVMPRVWPAEGIQIWKPPAYNGMSNAHLQTSSPGEPSGTYLDSAGSAGVVVSRAADIVGSPVYLREVITRFSGIGSLPLASMRLTSGFGLRSHPIRGGLRAHSGVDLAAPYGTPIAATSSGTVSAAGWHGGYGLLVALDHGLGRQTRYAHLSRLNVRGGQQVNKGDIIGFVGSTGMSTGPHLHYEVRVNGMAVNPLAGHRHR